MHRIVRSLLALALAAPLLVVSPPDGSAQEESAGSFIDLAAMYDAGTLSVDTDMTHGDAERQRDVLDPAATRGVVRDSASPPEAHYRLDFDEPLTIGAAGVILKPGYPESAVVEVSADGEQWDTLATYDAVDTGRQLDWTELDEQIEISHFRVRITDSHGEWPVLDTIALADEPIADPNEADVTVATASEGQGLWFPDIIKLDDGRLLAAYYEADSHVGPHGRIYVVDSSDGGHTWSEPRLAIDTEFDDRDPKLTQLSDGTVLLSFFQTDWSQSPSVVRGTHVIQSSDVGQSWSEPVKVGSNMDYDASHGAVTELPDGDLLIPLYGGVDGEPGRATVVRSTDGGHTWPEDSEVTIAANEPTAYIDLPGMYDAGTLAVDTDMTYGDAQRQRNVLDLGAAYGVVRDDATPPEAHLRIDFEEPQTISAAGVILKPGFPESAIVEASADGEQWETLATYDAVDTDRQLDWTNLEEPIEISHFRVRITDSHGQWPVLEKIALAEEPVMENPFDFQEPTLTVLDDGEIAALLRTTTSPQVAYLARSFDDGRSWTEAEPTDMPASSHHLLPLTGGGVLVTYGDVSSRFSPVRATSGRIVEDPAGSWDGYQDIPLYDSGHSDQANPSSAEVVPGLFLTLSFDVGEGTVVGVFSARDHYQPCTSTISGDQGRLNVEEGNVCLDGATVSGGVHVEAGASVVIRDSRINGRLSASDPASVTVCGTLVQGPVSVTDGRSVVLGNPDADCAPNTVRGPVTVSGVDGATLLAGNTFAGKLSCDGNEPPPTNGRYPNEVRGPATGQCTGL